MTLSSRRVRAIVRKEIQTYRRSRTIVVGMSIFPLIFVIQPLVALLEASSGASFNLRAHHELLYMLGIPALVPTTLAAYAIVGERQQGTLEPLLGTPIRRAEMVLGKALAVLLPSVAISYAVFALFAILVVLFADSSVASALIRAPDVVAQVVFTPLIAGWSIWLGIAISARAGEVRVAQQLGALASLPTIAVTTLLSLNVIHATRGVAIAFAVGLLIVNRLGWRAVSAMFDRERLITGSRSS
jgi:ABC-type transport system involved in multi-copper enzyme maturation permease subunit